MNLCQKKKKKTWQRRLRDSIGFRAAVTSTGGRAAVGPRERGARQAEDTRWLRQRRTTIIPPESRPCRRPRRTRARAPRLAARHRRRAKPPRAHAPGSTGRYEPSRARALDGTCIYRSKSKASSERARSPASKALVVPALPVPGARKHCTVMAARGVMQRELRCVVMPAWAAGSRELKVSVSLAELVPSPGTLMIAVYFIAVADIYDQRSRVQRPGCSTLA